MQPEPEKSTKTIIQINNQGGLAFGNAWRTEWKLFRIVFGYAKGTTCLSHWFDQRFTQGMQLYDRYNTTTVSMPKYIKSAYFMRNKSCENIGTQRIWPKFDLDMIMYVIGSYSRVSTE